MKIILNCALLASLFVLSTSSIFADDKTIREEFRKFLEAHDNVHSADKAIAMAKREGKNELARQLRFEAIDRIQKAKMNQELLRGQLEKLLVEVPSASWTESEKQIIRATGYVDVIQDAVSESRARELSPVFQGLTLREVNPDFFRNIIVLRPTDTFESLIQEIGQAPRYDAVIRLGLLNDPRGLDFLIRFFEDSRLWTIEFTFAVFRSIARIGGQRAADFLYDIYNSGRGEKFFAAHHLIEMNDSRILVQNETTLIQQVLGTNSDERDFAHKILRKTKPPEVVEPLLAKFQQITSKDVISDDESIFLSRLLITLAEIGDSRAIKPIQEAQAKHSPRIRDDDPGLFSLNWHMSIALGLLGEPSGASKFEKIFRDNLPSPEREYLYGDILPWAAKAYARIYVNGLGVENISILNFRRIVVQLFLRHSPRDIDFINEIDEIMAEFGKEKFPHVKARETVKRCGRALGNEVKRSSGQREVLGG